MKKWFWDLKLKNKFFLLILGMVLALYLAEMLNRQAAYNAYNQLIYEENSQMVQWIPGCESDDCSEGPHGTQAWYWLSVVFQ